MFVTNKLKGQKELAHFEVHSLGRAPLDQSKRSYGWYLICVEGDNHIVFAQQLLQPLILSRW